MTLLTRVGNKGRIAKDVQSYFPFHRQYIELFFGAGGMFFNKPKVKYNVLNDNDSDVYNLFNVVMNHKEEFIEQFIATPIHQDLWNYWRKNKEEDPIKRAIRFIVLSNYGYMGKFDTLKYTMGNTSQLIVDAIDETNRMLFGTLFMNCDFRDVLSKLNYRKETDYEGVFIYADPPYLDTDNTYESSFQTGDSYDLFDILSESKMKFAMSEFNHPFILQEAKRRNLNVHYVKERQNMKNRRIEVLIVNYDVLPQLF